MLKYTAVHVNSKKSITSKDTFNWNFVQRQKVHTGAIIASEELAKKIRSSGAASPFAGFDLLKNDLVGSCVLIDYNYVLMCMHTFNSFSTSEMSNRQVKIVFFNEYTEKTVDTANPKAQTTRPVANLRGDLGWWGPKNSDSCKEDFALVQIEWNKTSGVDDFHFLGHSATLPDPRSKDPLVSVGQTLCCIEEYSPKLQVEESQKEPFATYISYADVTKLNQGPMVSECTTGKQAIYAYAGFASCFGSSGSPVYDIKGQLVGILGGKVKTESFFLPLDIIYKCQTIGNRESITTQKKLENIYDYQNSKK